MINEKRNVAFLSTYPPRECGLATFTQDLARGLDKTGIRSKIIAVSDDSYSYGGRVIAEVRQHDRESYVNTAEAIGNLNIDLLVIEHEYGIFGGEAGEYILDLADNLQIPFVTTLHTVIPNPSQKQREVLKRLCEKSAKVVTMAENTRPVLQRVYDVEPSKIEMIHHGVPYMALKPRDELKAEHGLSGKSVVSTFGLLSPGKGLEYGIEAIARVAETHKDIVYLILGQTHPVVKKESGETYREKLIKTVDRLNIREHVRFVDKYLTKDEIIHYLQLSDIYMTPYLGKDQAVSGTLAYAVGYGRVIVSTPYSYAKEMLAGGRGLLAEFGDAGSLAGHIRYILENPKAKAEMEKRTLSVGRTMMWESVASRYAELFAGILDNGGTAKNKFKDGHIFRLTDDTGMLQHSKYSLPDPGCGYTTDDNARALIMALMLFERYGKKEYLNLAYRYASFLLNAQNERGRFKNFMRYDRTWLEEEGSEDCFGRCVWALGFAISNKHTPVGLKKSFSYMMNKAIPNVSTLNFARAKAYSILGLACLDGGDIKRIISDLAQSLCSQYDKHRDGEWKWFEDNVTYCNYVLPWSLIAAYKVLGDRKFLYAAEESLEFLSKACFINGYFKPVGCKGWYTKGGCPAGFDEQTVEACEGVLTYLDAYQATGKPDYLQRAKKCHEWYEGSNSAGISLIDGESGGCYDALTEEGLNLNMGAESLVSYFISYLKIKTR